MVGVYAVWVAANGIILLPRSPEMLAERANRFPPGVKSWDKVIISIYGVATLAKYLVAGFDHRNGWTGEFSTTLQFIMLVVALLAYLLVTWAMAYNAFFSMYNRLQGERGHHVASGGPYKIVRHPGYVGTVLFEIASPLALGSWWAFYIGLFSALLMVYRTAKEDKFLHEELPGYPEFAQQTRYRLIPGIW